MAALACAMPSCAALAQASLPVSDIGLELVAEIGSDLGETPYVFGSVRDVAVGPTGEIVVLDGMAAEVRVFGPNGGFLRSFGRQGGGPGEFVFPMLISESDSLVQIMDPQVSRTTAFRWSGELLGSDLVPFPEGIRTAVRVPAAHGHVLGIEMATWNSHAPMPAELPETVLVYSPDRESLDTLALYHSGGMFWRSQRGAGGVPAFYEPGGAWAMEGDSIVITADGGTGVLQWWALRRGGPVPTRTVRTGIVPQRLTTGEAHQVMDLLKADPELRNHYATLLVGDVETAQPSSWSGIRTILPTDGPEIWIHVGGGAEGYFGRGPPGIWVAVDRALGTMRRLPIPDGVRPRRVRAGLLYATTRTELDADVVRVYRLVARAPSHSLQPRLEPR